GAVELDALEALYPGRLEQILAQYMQYYYDVSLDRQVYEQRQRLGDYLQGQRQWGLDGYRNDIEALQVEYGVIRRDFEGGMAGYSERLRSLWQAVKSDLNRLMPDVAEFPVPEAECEQEVGEGLYNSERDYLRQVEAYKSFQGRL